MPNTENLLIFEPRARREASRCLAPEEPTDRALIAKTARGDADAFAALYDRHAGLALGVVRRILGDSGEAEEVLQETFLQVWREAGRYDGNRATPRGWIVMIARSRALDRLRSAAASVRREEGVAREEGLRFAAPVGSCRLERLEARRRVTLALSRLPKEQREVIELAFYRGLSHSQIANHLQAPLGTVKSRVLLGMRKLKDLLAAEIDAPLAQVGA
jgi:RNA polymerase sigma-70 factor (ECF subfamily)